MRKSWKKIIGIIFIIIGISVYLYPEYKEWQINRRTDAIIHDFEQKYSKATEPDSGSSSETETTPPESEMVLETEAPYDEEMLEELYREMSVYNKNLVENGQHLTDAWSYTQTPVNLDVLNEKDGAIGYIQIPDMDVTLPLYIGATENNMALGAAVLSETSMPIGGPDTNCVIAGHRGYGGAPFFRDIENLQEGSMVFLKNPWDTLAYKVTKIEIIDPHDVDSILIQPGKDLVTLLTCHPYMSHGKNRYIVFCERVEDYQFETEKEPVQTETAPDTVKTETSDGKSAYVISSKDFINNERIVRYLVPAALAVVFAVLYFYKRRR